MLEHPTGTDITPEVRQQYRSAISQLVVLIEGCWEFKFTAKRVYSLGSRLAYYYRCRQDKVISRRSKNIQPRQRDRRRSAKFACKSQLQLTVDLEAQTLRVKLAHGPYHEPFSSIALSPEAISFLSSRFEQQMMPGEAYQHLVASGLIGVEHIVQSQVYYQWKTHTSKLWKRDPDPLVSAISLLNEETNLYAHQILTSGHLRGLAIFIKASISHLQSAQELAIDATYGTNNSALNLFAILAEHDGTGVPLAYLFLGNSSQSSPVDSVVGAKIDIITQFLRGLQSCSSINPSFFGCDKDQAEIAAIRNAYPSTTIQLCYWHAKRAIRQRLHSASRTKTQNNYRPAEVLHLVPSLEICWGSIPDFRPQGPHQQGTCDCVSKLDILETVGRLETGNAMEHNQVLDIFSRHYNMHPLIPDHNGIYRSKQQIHVECTTEMYNWCRQSNYPRLWAYLWVNWYCSASWELWARSIDPAALPVLKTTMVVESHWRRIKRDFLHQFNRPRVDLVVWVLTAKAIPQAVRQMENITDKNFRQYQASWRKAFKKIWLSHLYRTQYFDPLSRAKNHTDPKRWVCSCRCFLLSRFLVCEHLISCLEPLTDRVSFFAEVRRQRFCPFWSHTQLKIRPELLSQREVTLTDSDDDASDYGESSDQWSDDEVYHSSDDDSDHQSVVVEHDAQAESVLEVEQQWARLWAEEQVEDEKDEYRLNDADYIAFLQALPDIYRKASISGNDRFLRHFRRGNRATLGLWLDIQHLSRQRTMPQTWLRWRHPATMFWEG